MDVASGRSVVQQKGKGKTKKGKGFQKGRQSLAERIASSTCRICGMKGHWKNECPSRDQQGGSDANVMTIHEGMITAEIVENLPTEHMASWEARQGVWCTSPGVPSEYPVVNEEFIYMSILKESLYCMSKSSKHVPTGSGNQLWCCQVPESRN